MVTFLESQAIPYMVIGGYANLFWGEPRLTRDLDFTVMVRDQELRRFVRTVAARFTVLVKDPFTFAKDTRVLPIATGNGVRTDIILAELPWEKTALTRAVQVDIGSQQIRICSAEDLIVHKIISERPRDLEDVKGIIKRQGPRLDRQYLDPIIRELSEALARSDIWEFYQSCLQGRE